jgi:hypothetical protein
MGQVEVTKVVGSHLHFEAVRSHPPLGNGHNPCIVNQDVDLIHLLFNPIRKLSDGVFITEIKRDKDQLGIFVFSLNLFDGFL